MEGVRETRFAESAGLSIAYQVVGDGPIDLVFVPGFMSHVELNWEYPFFSAPLEQLARFARLIVLDKRGTGLSDRSLGLGTFEERMDDVRAVMDAAGSERAAVFGLSEGAAVACIFAATYPDRVSSLVLYGGFCPGAPPRLEPEDRERFVDWIARHWTTGDVIDRFVQHPPDREDCLAKLARFERYCCTPQVAREIMRRNLDGDVRAVLPTISVPTLVIHADGDPISPVAHAHYYAEHIPGAHLHVFEGDFHGSWRPSDSEPIAAGTRAFLTGEAAPSTASASRILATVLFTDIADSTATAAEMGDARWRTLLDDHDAAAREEVEGHGGVWVKSTGDGILARFDGPSRAVTCAHSLRRRAEHLGLRTRAGAHTGEVELRGDDVGGIAVHIASRVASLADAGEVLVSRTVKDLTVGSALSFEDRGEHRLKGVPDPWQVFAASV